MYSSRNIIKSFNEISYHDFEKRYLNKIKEEIFCVDKDYILAVDEEEYKNYLTDKYTLEPINIFKETESFSEPNKKKETVGDPYYQGHTNEREVYEFTIKYSYTGSEILFEVQSNPWTMRSHEIYLNKSENIVSFDFNLYKQDAEEFQRTKEDCFTSAFANVKNINKNVLSINTQIKALISREFDQRKSSFINENNFFKAIKADINPKTKSIFTAPTIKKKQIPKPVKNNTNDWSSEPIMSMEMYLDVLKVIYEAGKSMEKKTALFKDKNEEGLRDQFLFILETRYEGITATGETFNKKGKTDILLKYAIDNSNLFVGECKFWHGASEFHAAINQLFDRYLTWRDSKAAILLFVKNKDFTKTISVVKTEIEKHPYYKNAKGSRGESSLSFIFGLPHDKDKDVYLEIILFDYYEEKTTPNIL